MLIRSWDKTSSLSGNSTVSFICSLASIYALLPCMDLKQHFLPSGSEVNKLPNREGESLADRDTNAQIVPIPRAADLSFGSGGARPRDWARCRSSERLRNSKVVHGSQDALPASLFHGPRISCGTSLRKSAVCTSLLWALLMWSFQNIGLMDSFVLKETQSCSSGPWHCKTFSFVTSSCTKKHAVTLCQMMFQVSRPAHDTPGLTTKFKTVSKFLRETVDYSGPSEACISC